MQHQIYPWNQQQWQQITTAFNSGRMPHAVLLQGAKGLGKLDFAKALSAFVLCSKKGENSACGECHTCKLLRADTHPDYKEAAPADEGKSILVDQIRDFCDFFIYSSQLSSYKAGIIHPADRMNRNAANSLLKTLEEPTKNSLIILVAESTTSLPATIKSRCQVLEFAVPDKAEAISWLQFASGASQNIDLALSLADYGPLEALDYLKCDYLQHRQEQFEMFAELKTGKVSPTKAAEKLSKSLNRRALGWMISWIQDMIKLKMVDNTTSITNFDIAKRLTDISKNISISGLYGYYDKVSTSLGLIDRQANLQLVLEDLFVSWIYLEK
ncbi:MAG: DNA polymerase III subunit delta' [Gammaproteobacteria bacterium]|nr:MAG: DNA polymerase III subunit delta' [Gammaproteobacteria bacterium]